MTAASPLRAALLASVTRRGQWVGPALLLALACALAAVAVPRNANFAALSGWSGAIGFVLSLLLTVRARTWAARFGGLDHQYAWHHVLGLAAYGAVLLHALAVIAPWLAGGEFRSALGVWFAGSAALSGWLALALLVVPLAATFYGPRDFRAWLGWHRVAAVAFAAVLVHLLLAAGNITGSWLVAVIGAGALAARAAVQRLAAGRRYLVARVTHPARACVEVDLVPLGRALTVQPGQYVFAAFHGGEHYTSCSEYHPFTVSHVDGPRITLTIKALGDCTLAMQQLTPGLAAWIEGPFGAFFDRAHAGVAQLWIAGGIGITPFLAQLDRLGPDVDIKMAYLFRSGTDVLHMDELQQAADARAGMELVTLVSATELGPLWRWLDTVDVERREVYVCGPPPLLDAIIAYLSRRSVPETRLHFERFDFR